MGDGFFKHLDFADSLGDHQAGIGHEGYSGRIIPTIFEAFKPRQKDRQALFASDISNYTAHNLFPALLLPEKRYDLFGERLAQFTVAGLYY
jgi:hypothetical protein